MLVTAGEAIRAVSRLLAAVAPGQGAAAVEEAVTREARVFAGASAALLLRVDEQNGIAVPVAGDPEPPQPADELVLSATPAVADALAAELALRLDGAAARSLAHAVGLAPAPEAALLLPLRPPGTAHGYVLMLADDRVRGFALAEIETMASFLAAAGASLGQVAALEQRARETERHAALARAAKALNESLDLARVLPRICDEAAGILGADAVAVYRGGVGGGMVMEASSPRSDRVGERLEPGAGIAGRAIDSGHAVVLNDGDEAGAGAPVAGIRSGLAVPMRWDGEARGVVWVGFRHEHAAGAQDAALLESFAELAAVACRNASVQAALAEAARTDGLTGCLNHAALHETLRREMQRSRRTGRRLSIVLVDLDHFKQVNERHGHLVGDEVLRRVGRGLQEAVRPYDFVARYGGDEFAIVAVDAHEARAAEIGERAIHRLSVGLDEVLGEGAGPHATAGVSEWTGAQSPSDLVREADRALLYGKQQGVRGGAVNASDVPPGFALGGPFGNEERPRDPGSDAGWPSAVREETEPLRRRTRQLTLANALGARLAEMTHVQSIVDAAVEELHRAFGYLGSAVVRLGSEQTLEAVAVRGRAFDDVTGGRWRKTRATDAVERCLADRQPVKVGDVVRPPGYVLRAGDPGSEAAVPIWVGADMWGVLDVLAEERDGFDEADVRLLETVSDQLGSALRSATLYEQLERAYLGTAEVLAAALETKDSHTAEHASSMVRNAEVVGRRLGMSDDELRELRYAAAFHDIGKIAVPERILNKPGPLTESEKLEVERHTVAGEQILSPVAFLAGVLPLVRHCHERWDGGGYPDGLAGDRIPLGARVIFVCDAHEAMTTDRPYRRALAPDVARAEIRAAAGREYDSRVTDAFLAAVGGR
jgi:diguanylate cyclase (GGDEF)-like protein